MAAILIFLVSRSENSADRIFIDLGMAIFYIAVLLTVFSGLDYIWRYRQILLNSFKKSSDSQ